MSKRALPSEWETTQQRKWPAQVGSTEASQSLTPQSGLSKTYSHFHATGHARMHAGDVYNINSDDLPGPGSFSNIILRTIGCAVFFDSRIADLLSSTPAARSKDVEIKRWLDMLTNLQNELQDRANADLERERAGANAELETADRAGVLKEAAWNLFYLCARSRTETSEIDAQRHKVRDFCDALASVLLDTIEQSAKRHANFDHLNHALDVLPISEMSYNVCVAFSIFQHARISPLLMKLKENMHRPRKVLDPIPDTYHWALDHDEAGLKSWLQSGSAMHWIAGKPGCGKSTLMKFLIGSAGHLLANWAGGHRLVVASFFFWYAGSPLQKSIAGLLRSILHQLLWSNRSLANLAFPRWHPNQEPWSETELINGLKNLIDSAPLSLVVERFCFFIDGLDEYSGSDHLELISIIQDLAKSQHVKLCISSRPLYAYRLAYETSVPHLCLENLNANDIRVYVSGRLTNASRPIAKSTEVASLIREVVDGAEGVFVWTVLVVESILEGLTEGESINFIRHRIKEFPQDLEPFFEAILQRVSHVYTARSRQALKLAWLSTKFSESQMWIPNWTDYWLISKHPRGIKDPAFAYQLSPEIMPVEKADLILDETRQLLSAATKGLLVLNGEDRRVEIIHRTVHEFLDSAQMRQKLDDAVPDHFKSKAMLHLLSVTRMKLWLPRTSYQESFVDTENISKGVAKLLAPEGPIALRKSGEILDSLLSADEPDHGAIQTKPGDLRDLNKAGEYAIEFERAAMHVRNCLNLTTLDMNTLYSLKEFVEAIADMTGIYRQGSRLQRRTSSEAASPGELMIERAELNTNAAWSEPALGCENGFPAATYELFFNNYGPEVLLNGTEYALEISDLPSSEHEFDMEEEQNAEL